MLLVWVESKVNLVCKEPAVEVVDVNDVLSVYKDLAGTPAATSVDKQC
jgi:hypothetical protein